MKHYSPMTMRFTPEMKMLEEHSPKKCLGCGKELREGDTAHFGYDGSGRALCVGDCCSKLLTETALRVYVMLRPIDVPPKSAKLWRYMDLTRFVSMLNSRALYFSRLDQFADPFEGALGSSAMEQRWKDHYRTFFRSAIKNPPPGYACEKSAAEIEKDAERLLEEFSESNRQRLKQTFVNCWYEAEHESDAMWKLYSKDFHHAIAVQTRYPRLKEALGTDCRVEVGRVRYIDFSEQYPDVNAAHFFKRKAFEHEREVRLAFQVRGPSTEIGKLVEVDLPVLLVGIFVSPFSPKWFEELITDVAQRYDVNAKVHRSLLDDAPFF